MKSITNAKDRAQAIRAIILAGTDDLFQGIAEYVKAEYEFTIQPVPADAIDGAKGVLNGDHRAIYYDQDLDNDPVQRLLVVAHELGHLVLHKRLTDRIGQVDLLSPYLNTGGPALARYNRRSREEIEADAFANEFVLPSREVFDVWLADETSTSTTLAKKYGLSNALINSRLAEALFEETLVIPPVAVTEKRGVNANPMQIQASQHSGSPVLVKAGPGTGKTATLIMRIGHLLGTLEAHPGSLLVLTFSNEAAEELRDRVEEEFDIDVAEQIEITTFHGFGHAALITWESDLPEDFLVLDESRQEEMAYDILGSIECDAILTLRDPRETSRECIRQITRLKERGVTPEMLESGIEEWRRDEPLQSEEQAKAVVLLNVYESYETIKSEAKAVDFADLINIPLRMMRASPELTGAFRAKHKWVMVDEYQDVSRSVAQLLRQMCGPENPPWVVGDVRQAIYLFCGAAPENLNEFRTDFPSPKLFELDLNYRSCDDVIEVANQLAELMEDPTKGTPDFQRRWQRGSSIERLGDEQLTIKLAEANSDAAEYDGVSGQVSAWLDQRVPADEIAVLARRNRDVRDIALELGRRGLKVTTPGLITPDGPAGSLASVCTYVDGSNASLPRIVYALGKDRFGVSTLNRAIEVSSSPEAADASSCDEDLKLLVREIERLDSSLQKLAYSGDAFDMICAFLFDGSAYLRQILKNQNESQRILDISEIISALSWAIAYRYSHPDTVPKQSRLGFGQYFRGILTSAKPSIAPPRKLAGAIQVMTCHASKGLQFPCVAVAGQTLSGVKDKRWYPPKFEPEPVFDQSDALFFVGASRAQRSLCISYAKTARRTVVPLLKRWVEVQGIQLQTWASQNPGKEEVVLDPVWGFNNPKKRLSAASLEKGNCGIQVYVQDVFGGRFPTAVDGLYPRFFAAVRRSIGQVVSRFADGDALSARDAEELFLSEFVRGDVDGQPFFDTFRRRGIRYISGFAAEFASAPVPVSFVETDDLFGGDMAGDLIPIRFDICAHYKDQSGTTHAVMFRPQGLGETKNGVLPDELNWSALPARNQISLTLLRELETGILPWVYSGDDGKLYRLKWNQKVENMGKIAAEATARRAKFSGVSYDAKISEFKCEFQCESRSNCPHWMNPMSQE